MPVAVYVQPGESSFWQTQSRDFQSLGWSEHVLPDGFTYFSHSSLRGRLTADIDLRNASKLDALLTFLDRKDVGETLAAPSEGWEVWLRDAGRSQDEFIAAKAWVYHPKRVVSLNQPPARTEDFKIRDEEKLEMEYRYWSFIETHPAHSPLPSEAIQEAIDALTWSYTDRLLPSSHSAPPPFTQEECQELIALLHSLDGNSTTQSIVRTRVIAKIFLRITTWRQGRSKHHATSNRHGDSHQRVPLRRTVGDFLVSIRSHHQRIDAESGMRSTAGPMLIVGACACVIAAIVLSASVTFISLPGLDDVARVAGFIAIILSASSLMSSVITLFRYKVDIERPPAYARGEGLVLLSRRSVLLSLPLVFLIWAIAAFITAVTLYAFRGLATTEHGGFTRHFQDYTQWAVVGTIGGLAGVLIMSTFLIHY
ncbi:hypothetical protein BV25DRAFT_1868650 [Artomyces pyxidatus]|uniref:Uncharacterized protein n=1 Tax=Artomyces pyxidatus TaxID=48021 RepID=A0ACB8TCJ7_9AGAM|nr:hypothetical protein BV25DRAFT_1868650 [Artomyces pyxidatus]